LLTARQVLAATDGDCPDGGGLVLRVGGGSASWVFRYTAPSGKRREMGLGPAYRASVAQAGESITSARDAAHAARELLRRDVDPLDERDRQQQAARAAEATKKAEADRAHWTLARCARDYHARVIERTRTTRHAASWIQSLETHLPASIWHDHIDDIKPPALLAALEAAQPHERARRPGDLGETMRRVRQRLDAVCEDAVFHQRANTNPAAAVKRKLSEARPAARVQHLRALPFAEMPALVARLRAMQGTAARCLELALLTASRTSEVLFATWDEFDTAAGVWIVKAERMKLRQAHRVHLSPRALQIIEAQRGQSERFVFPSPQPGREGAALSNMAMLVTLDRLGVRDRTTVHGLCRSTFSTWANESGAARPDVIEACLAHSETDHVRKAYNRASFDAERRALLMAWADYVARPAAPVVVLNARAAA
jgi:integrase